MNPNDVFVYDVHGEQLWSNADVQAMREAYRAGRENLPMPWHEGLWEPGSVRTAETCVICRSFRRGCEQSI